MSQVSKKRRVLTYVAAGVALVVVGYLVAASLIRHEDLPVFYWAPGEDFGHGTTFNA